MLQFSVLEEHRDAPVLDFAAVGTLAHENIVPAIPVEYVAYHGCSEDETNLIAGQARFEEGEHLLSHIVALLNLDPIGSEARQSSARRHEEREHEDERAGHDQPHLICLR